MAYTKTTWVDRLVEFANRYTKSGETATEVTLTASPGTVTQAGTPISAANLNKIEQGIADAHMTADAALPAASYTAADVLAKLLTVDGAGTGLDADFLDGLHATDFTRYFTLNSGDLNTINSVGLYRVHNTVLNRPPVNYCSVIHMDSPHGNWVQQMAFGQDVSEIYFRRCGDSAGTRNWQPWNRLWHSGNTPQTRINAGVFEFLDGSTWKVAGGNGMYVASATQQFLDATERTNSTSRYVLAHKFIPMFTGEIKVSADLRASGNGTGSQARLMLVVPSKASGGTLEHMLGGLAPGSASLINYETPVGTLIGNDLNVAPYHSFLTLSNSSTTYANSSAIINVVERMPIYLLLQGSADAGAVSNDCQIKNLKISYDIIRGG